MKNKDTLINFSIKGFENIRPIYTTNGKHKHVLKDKLDNFIDRNPNFKFHTWAGSFKSSQAFAYNLFSGIDNAEFEFDMWALDNDINHKACIDVSIEENGIVKMYEVKLFEFAESCGKNQIFHKPEHQKYFNPNNYRWNKEIPIIFISFIQELINEFNNQKLYGEGIKQLCCHLLGIINEMTIPNGKLINKKVELYSLCFDNPIDLEFSSYIENYKKVLDKFQGFVDKFLKESKLDKNIKYCGFLPVSEFINDNSTLLGVNNCNYVKNRYYY